jgi:hypothetical protein
LQPAFRLGTNAKTGRVVAFVADRGNFNVGPPDEFLEYLGGMVEEFNIAPDVWIDVKRLPVSVDSWNSLRQYMRGLRTQVENKSEAIQAAGLVKLYKLLLCCIHGLHAYLRAPDGPTYPIARGDMVTSAMRHASIHPPVGLSDRAMKLWKATFEGSPSRPTCIMATLIYFMYDDEYDEEGDLRASE